MIFDPFYFIEGRNFKLGGGKGGGGSDSSAMVAYGDKALGLQKDIYDSQRADAQPWYQTGTQAVNRLSTLLGLSGTPSATTRESLVKQYTPQFTTQSGGGGTMYVGPDGKVYDTSNPDSYKQDIQNGFTTSLSPTIDWGNLVSGKEQMHGSFKPLNQQTSTTDTAGLNSYIDNLLSQQQSASSDPAFGSLAKNFSMDDYQADPGYQFRLDQGQQALERKLNASGKTYSPEAAKALLNYNQGAASQEYGNAYNRYNNDQDTLFNRLAALSGYGQTASGQVANAGSNYANAGSDILTSQGNAITAANQAKGGSSMFGNLMTALGTGAQAYAAFSDERLKEDIEPDGFDNGIPMYQFNYIGGSQRYRGTMAQDVLEIKPEAVILDHSGYYRVNYGMLGIEMTEV